MTLPLVTIVTPSFRQVAFLEAAIRSVIEQDYPRIEYIIIDGGSTDGSVDVIRRYERQIAWWVSAPDRGQADAIATGWERGSGEILGWLNADDVYLPGAVRRAVDALERATEATLAYGRCDLVDEATGTIRALEVVPLGLADVLARRGLIAQPAAFAPARAVREVGGLDRSLRFVMDFDLWIRLLTRGPATFIDGPPLARYRQHAATKSRMAAAAFAWELLGVLDRYYGRPDVPGSAREVRAIAYAQAHLVGARAALGSDRDLVAAIGWLLRAFRAHPPSAARAVRAVLARAGPAGPYAGRAA